MWKKALLTATVAGALAIGSTAAIAQTSVDASDEAPVVAVQTQARSQIQDPALLGTADAPAQSRQQLQVHDPALMGIDPLLVQERAELQVGTATQIGDSAQDRLQLQDPLAHDGDYVGNGIGDGTGDCDEEPRSTLAEDGTGNKFGRNS